MHFLNINCAMKKLIFFGFAFFGLLSANAQLYINSPIIVQSGEILFADDTVKLGSISAVQNNGIIQSSKAVQTSNYIINTSGGGFVISPVASGVATSFDIGSTNNNRIIISHTSASAVHFKMGLRNSIYVNPTSNNTQINTNVVGKTWQVQPLTASAGTNLTFFWNAADELSSFNRSVCGVGRWQSGTSTNWSFVSGTSAANLTGTTPAYSRSASTGNMSSVLYYFGIGGSGSALPIELLLFNAVEKNEDVLINWITGSEINSDYFEVQRCSDALYNKSDAVWDVVGKLNAAGNSNAQINYVLNDEKPFKKWSSSKLFYRLKSVDLDGRFSLSEIQEVNLNKTNSEDFTIAFYPNPTHEKLNILLHSNLSKQVDFILFDIHGKQILKETKTFSVGLQTTSLDVGGLAAGAYLLYVNKAQEQNILKHKIIIY